MSLSTRRKIINVCNPLDWPDRFNLEESVMRQISALILSLILPVLLLAQPKQSVQSKQIALAHVTVIDATGAVVPAATVAIQNKATNFSQTDTSRAGGEYTFAYLPPGTYEIRVSKPGFRASLVPEVKLDTAAVFRADVTLQVGEVAETVWFYSG